MTTTNVKAKLDPHGAVDLKFNCFLNSHQAREILDAVCDVLKASHTDGKVVVTDKDEESLVRKAKEDLEQTTIQEVIEDDAPADDEPEEPHMEEY